MKKLTAINIILMLFFASCEQAGTSFADAKRSISEKDYQSAIQTLDKIIEKDKRFDSAYFERAIAYEGLGEFENAINDYDRAAADPVLRSQAKYSIACIYFNNQQYDVAADICAEIIADDPGFHKAYFGRGFAKMNIKLYDNKGNLQSTAKYSFDDKGTFYYDYDGALSDLNKCIELNDQYKAAYVSRGQLYLAIDKINLAINDYNKAIEIDGNYFDAFMSRACLYKELKDFKKALSDFNMAIKIKPEDPFPYANRGYLKRECNEAGACEDLRKAEELGLPMSDEDKKQCR